MSAPLRIHVSVRVSAPLRVCAMDGVERHRSARTARTVQTIRGESYYECLFCVTYFNLYGQYGHRKWYSALMPRSRRQHPVPSKSTLLANPRRSHPICPSAPELVARIVRPKTPFRAHTVWAQAKPPQQPLSARARDNEARAYLHAPTPRDSRSVPSDSVKCHSDRVVRPLRGSRRRPRRADHHRHPGAVGRRGAVRAWLQAQCMGFASSHRRM